MRCLHGGNRGFSRVHSLRKTGALFNAGFYVSSERRRGHDIIARGSCGKSSQDEGTLRSRFVSERYTILPNMMDRDDTRSVKGAERLIRTWHSTVRSSIFAVFTRCDVKMKS